MAVKDPQKTVEECAEQMADFALGLLSDLPAEEREARIRAMEKTAASFPEPPSRPGPDGRAG